MIIQKVWLYEFRIIIHCNRGCSDNGLYREEISSEWLVRYNLDFMTLKDIVYAGSSSIKCIFFVSGKIVKIINIKNRPSSF